MGFYSDFLKCASARSDFWAADAYSIPEDPNARGGAVDALAHINGAGSAVGAFSEPATEEDELAWDQTPEQAMLPGVADMRMQRRLKRQLVNTTGNTPHFWSQRFGRLGPMLLLALAGGLGGHAVSKRYNLDSYGRAAGTGVGAILGLLGGGLASEAAGGLAAAITPTRTKEEQSAYANSPVWSEYVIPGRAGYNFWKTIGRSFADSDERIRKMREQQA